MKRLINEKKALEMSFAWMFSLFVGAVILFLTIYMVVRLVNTEEYEFTTKVANELSILLEPLETSIEGGIAGVASVPNEIKIFNHCYETGTFGSSSISVASKVLGNRWSAESAEISNTNKYIFSDEIEGEDFYIFVKPVEMPFKISDLIVVYSKKYCFTDLPNTLQFEIQGLSFGNKTNIVIDDCEEDDVKVCFSGGDCDIEVDCYDDECSEGDVRTQEGKMYFQGNLIYGAIFSDPEIYECNVNRLMTRLEKLSLVYSEKANFIAARGCSTGLEGELISLSSYVKSTYDSSNQLTMIRSMTDSIEDKNNNLACQLF